MSPLWSLLFVTRPAAAVVLVSVSHPIQVTSEDEALATEALSLAEAAWEDQVEGMGFAPPLMLDGHGSVVQGFDLVLWSMGSGSLATFDVLGDHPATPASDCPVRSEINADYMDRPGWMGMCVAHLLNHASLHAVDCLEPQMPAFDTISVAVEVLTGQAAYWDLYVERYQQMPYESVDMWFRSAPNAYYQFGSSLFALFLDAVYGGGDGALLADLWSLTAQDGTITRGSGELAYGDVENEPDYLDAVGEGLMALGSTFDEAWTGFTAHRWFVGPNDDGAHLPDAGSWPTGAPLVDATWTEADLPLADQPAVEAMAEYASSFVVFEVEPRPGTDLLLEVEGSEGIAWGAIALAVPGTGPATARPFTMADGVRGAALVPLEADIARVVLAVASLSDGTHDPEDADRDRDHTYRYAASLVEAASADDTGQEDETMGGCACGTPRSTPRAGSLLAPLVALGAAGRRRHRPIRRRSARRGAG